MPQSSAGQLSFVETEALKMSPGWDVSLKLSAVKNVVLRNHQVSVQLIADTVGISTGSIKTILHEHLLMTKASTRWIPGMPDQKVKDCPCEASSENLKLMQLDWNLFVERILTGDETGIHDYNLESKQQSM